MTKDRAISLNAVKDLYCRICMESNLCYRSKETCEDLRLFDKLPSVNPQEPKTGHWILDETDNSITCDKCGCLIWANDISNGEAYYCPNCGAKMVEPQESEDKE